MKRFSKLIKKIVDVPKLETFVYFIKNTAVNFSSHQRNLMKTFQIEGMIALITKITLIFSSDLLNGQK